MLPEADHSYPLATQGPAYVAITPAIPRYLLRPEGCVLLWGFKTFWAAVPKAAVYKDGNAPLRKVEIRSTGHIGQVQFPPRHPRAPQQRGEPPFRAPVSAMTNRGHDF
jgi:hypothetical protein